MQNAYRDEHAEYNLDHAWPMIEPTNARDCFEQLVAFDRSRPASAYHGALRNWNCIRSSLDLYFERNGIRPEQRRECETQLLESFAEEADPHLSAGAHRHIELARLRWRTVRSTGTLYVGRHHGLPTRCVDWTSNWLIGLFFACRRDFTQPGVVWWMDNREFSDGLEGQWLEAYQKKGDVEADFEQDFIKAQDRDVFMRLRYPAFMDRAKSQEAWITLAGQYDIRHDQAIHRLNVRTCGRTIIKPSMKRELLDTLDRWGVNGASLGLADECVETIATDVAKRIGEGPCGLASGT